MRREYGKWLVAALLLAGLLSGCGSEGNQLPETYTIGEETLPAIGAVQESEEETSEEEEAAEEETVPEVICQTQTDEETGVSVYTYSGLESGLDTVRTYLRTLLDENGFSVIDEEGFLQEEPDLTAEEGSILVGKETEDQTGLMELDLQWTRNLCEVTAKVEEGKRIQTEEETPEQTLTVEQAVQQLQNMDPADLGLSDSAGENEVFAEDGYALVDGQECYRLNRYTQSSVGTPVISGTYLLSLNGKNLYRLDRDTNEVTLLQGN